MDGSTSRAFRIEKKLKELEFLIASSRMLNSTLNLERLLRVIMKIVQNAIDVEAVSILLLDEERRNLVFELARGRRDRGVRGFKLPLGEGVAGWVAKNDKPLVLNEVKKDRRFSLELEKKLRLKTRSVICIPLRRRGKLIGVLEGVNRKGKSPFTEDDLSIFTALGDHIATAIENAKLYSQVKRRSLESQLLYRISVTLGASLSLDEVLRRILASLRKLVHFDAAGIFVLDRRHQMMVSEIHEGYGSGIEERIRLKLDEGVVGWAARKKTGVIVGDCLRDKRYVSAREKTRSEMVAPMLSRGRVIGLFNLESDRKNAYTREDLELLDAFAAQAAVSIERARLYEEHKKRLELQRELRVARTIQEFFTPKKSRRIGSYDIAGANFPSLAVSGDYYDFFPLNNSSIAFAIADVAGKGVPASIIMSGFRATLHTAALSLSSARSIALMANKILLETVRPQDFVTAFIGVLSPEIGEITYCNAGHNPPLLVDRRGSYRLLEIGGPVLGVFEDLDLQEGRFALGDEILFCYTDGITEARDEKGEEFGVEKISHYLQRCRRLSAKQICKAMHGKLVEHVRGRPLLDDVTFLVLKKNLLEK